MLNDAQNSNESFELAFEGALTWNQAHAMKERLMDALGRADHVMIDLAGIEGLDFACMQLFCAAHRSAEKACKKLTISRCPKNVLQQVVSCGLARYPSCLPDAHSKCPWFWTGACVNDSAQTKRH